MAIELLDLKPDLGDFMSEAITGLQQAQPSLPCKYFYDARGAELFERICELPEYYPTRVEVSILQQWLPQIAKLIGSDTRIVEYGSGAGDKIRMLLDALPSATAYTPIDISREQLVSSAQALQQDYPALEILPVCADYQSELNLPNPSQAFARTLVFFPGSTLGNFTPEEALPFLQRLYRLSQQGDQPGMLLLGVDLKKDRQTLEAAYNDSQGITAAFNLNLLQRINQELDGEFELNNWQHRAHWNEQRGAIEMHLISTRQQTGRINGNYFEFAAGDSIHTENSFKYEPDELIQLIKHAGFTNTQQWLDPQQRFACVLATA